LLSSHKYRGRFLETSGFLKTKMGSAAARLTEKGVGGKPVEFGVDIANV